MIDKVTVYHEASKGGFKQWSIWIEPDLQTVTVEWGIVGKTLQRSSDTAKPKGKVGTKSYKDAVVCARENYDRQIRKKREEGYRDSMTAADVADWLTGLDKNFVPAKPLVKLDEAEVIEGIDNGTLWAQRKRDGRRTLALKTRNGDWKLYSRRMEDLTEHLSLIRSVLIAHDVPSGTIIDGEIIVDRNGADDFRATGTFTNPAMDPADANARQVEIERTGGTIQFYVFDILYHDGNACWALPYSERYELLERYFSTSGAGRVVLAPVFGGVTYDHVKEMVLHHKWEGLILWFSKEGSFLRTGGKPKRTGCAKWKPIKEQDFIATGYFLGSGELSEVTGGLTLAEYAPDGSIRNCGKVGTGFDAAMRREAMTWEYPCVVSVKFDSQEPTGKLRFPVFLKKHEDKTPDEVIGVELESDDE